MRPLWFVAGVGAGAYAVLRARRVAEALTPEGLADRVAGLRLGWEMFGEEVRTGMAEKETELRATLLRAPDGPAALPAPENGAADGGAPDAGTDHSRAAEGAPVLRGGDQPDGHQ